MWRNIHGFLSRLDLLVGGIDWYLYTKGRAQELKQKKKKEKKEMEELLFRVSKSHQSLVMFEIQLVKYNCIVVVFNNYPW